MKTSIIYTFFVVFTVAITSCKKEFPDDPLAINNLTVSDCKTEGDNVNGIFAEYITLRTVDNYYLQYNHINSMFNCALGQITVSIEISSSAISINEKETSSLANCICPYDLEFRLGPLQYGSYTIKFQKGGGTFMEYSLDFKKSTDVKIDI